MRYEKIIQLFNLQPPQNPRNNIFNHLLAASDVLSHFAQTVGTVLVPTLANELHNTRANRSTAQGNVAATRRQATPQDAPLENNNNVIPGAGLPFGGQGFPYQYERTLSYRYPPYAQQLSQNFFPGGVGFGNGVPLDPRFFQGQLGGPQLAPIQPTIPKPLNANINGNGNNNLKVRITRRRGVFFWS